MRLLLDTHTLVWWLAGDDRLTEKVRALLSDEAHEILVSAATAWELSTKHRLGKLPGVAAIVDDLATYIDAQGFIALDITLAHAQRAGALAGAHRDPFDRMLAAQAHIEDLILVSADEALDAFGVRRVW